MKKTTLKKRSAKYTDTEITLRKQQTMVAFGQEREQVTFTVDVV